MKDWQKRAIRLLDNTFNRTDFQKDIQMIRNQPESSWLDEIIAIMQKYKLPSNSYGYLKKYVASGEKDPEQIISLVRFVSMPDKTLYPTGYENKPDYDPEYGYHSWVNLLHDNNPDMIGLLLEVGVTKTELKNYIDEYWDSLIQPKLREFDNRKVGASRLQPLAERDEKVWNAKGSGQTVKEIARDLDMLPEEVSSILRKVKNRRKI